jgi:hypothetical protein
MLSLSRLAVTASVAAALAVPAAAQARPDAGGPHSDDQVPASIDKRAPDTIYGIPDPSVKYISTPGTTEVVEADNGFEWADAAIGGGAALLLTAVVGGAALTIRPRRAGALH